jgi:CheY-like chemotaxis protein
VKEVGNMAKILVVDDEVHIRALLEQTLEELEDDYDVEILSAANGEEGLELIREERPDLVFLDVMMPKMNGYDVCRRVKGDPELKDVKIILLTAKGQEVDKKQGLEAGALKYITKPFDPDEILEEAKSILGLE